MGQSHRIGETLGGSQLTIHLVDARTLTDARAFDRAIQILDGGSNLAVLFLALKPIPKRRRERPTTKSNSRDQAALGPLWPLVPGAESDDTAAEPH